MIWEPSAAPSTDNSGDVVYSNENEYYTYHEKTSNLGIGWSWAFPSIEQRETMSYLHFGDGTVYPIADGGEGLVGYTLQDVTFGPSSELLTTQDASGAEVSEQAAYMLSDTMGTGVYFNATGQWIGTKDVYDNVILVQYTNQEVNEQQSFPQIDKIIDTLNREITFEYTPESVVITYAPGKSYTYNKRLITNTNKKRALTSVMNENQETVAYSYRKNIGRFDYDTSDSEPEIKTTYYDLIEVQYPTEARSVYEYTSEPAVKRLGSSGTLQYYRVAKRYEEIRESIYKKKNVIAYDYSDTTDFSDPSVQSSIVKWRSISNPNDPTHIERVEKIAGSYTLNADHQIIHSVREKDGEYKQEIDTTYDPASKLALSVTESNTDYTVNPPQAAAKTFTYMYDTYGNVLSSANPAGHTRQYTYSTQYPGLLISQKTLVSGITVDDIAYTEDSQYPQINMETRNYKDDNGQIAQLETSYQYDNFGNATDISLALEDGKVQHTEIEYAPAVKHAYPTKIKQHVTQNGTDKVIEERYEYDLPTGRVTRYYDGNAVQKGAPEDAGQSYEYDPVGRLTKITHPRLQNEAASSSSTYSYTYDTIDQTMIMQHSDEEGRQTKQIYDGIGRPYQIQLQQEDGFYPIETNHYNDLGELDYIQDGEGHKTYYEYHANGDLKSETSAEGRVLGFAYNAMMEQATTTTDYGEKITTTTDAIGRETEMKREDGSTGSTISHGTAYEVNGDPFAAQTTDGNGSVTSFTANGLHRLQNVTQSVDEQQLQTTYQYNKLGSLTSKVFPDLSNIAYTYDELGRRLSKQDSVLGTEMYTYDDNHNITGGTTRNAKSVLNQFDERNRLRSWSSGDKNGSFTYYKNGLRKSMTDETGTTQYVYQNDNLLQKVTYPDGKTLEYTYYKNGLRKTMKDPFGVTATYIYNQDNQLKEVRTGGSLEAEYIYRDNLDTTDPNYKKSSQLYQTKLANGQLMTTYLRDGFGRLSTLTQSGPAFTETYEYGYDDNDNIISRSEGTTNGEFTYDALNRILTSTEGSEIYTYDAKGNRLTLQSSIQSPHTDNVEYTYDDAEQLSTVQRGGAEVTYRYNGDGLMTERTETVSGVATTTCYYYDGMNIVAEGSVHAGQVTFKARYVRGAQLIYREDAEGKAYYLQNGHGDITALRQADGTLLSEYAYDIWGSPLPESDQEAGTE
ncbi:RHS repeat protein, partial [Paenibacillus lemnae]